MTTHLSWVTINNSNGYTAVVSRGTEVVLTQDRHPDGGLFQSLEDAETWASNYVTLMNEVNDQISEVNEMGVVNL